jgi:endonuclease III
MKATKEEIEMACAALISARTTRDLLLKVRRCPRTFIERADALAMDIEELADQLAECPVVTRKARA